MDLNNSGRVQVPVQRPQNAQAVDRWVQKSLAQRFDDTLREPLPEALVKLLGETESS